MPIFPDANPDFFNATKRSFDHELHILSRCEMSPQGGGLNTEAIHTKIKLLISNLVRIEDKSGTFLLKLDDGRVIDTKGWHGWEWTHGIGLYGLWQYYTLTGSTETLDIIKEWFANRLAVGTTKNINTMAVYLTLACLYEETGDRSYLPFLEEWGKPLATCDGDDL